MHGRSDIERGGPARPAPGSLRAARATLAWRIAIAAALVAGVAVRAAAARGDLWLDEIWSIELARTSGSLLDVLTRIHHDNNHHLNTAWAWLVGDGASPVAYRLLALASSAGMLAIAAGGLVRRDAAEGLATTVLLAASHLLVHYGSEARGYATAAMLAVAAFRALDRWLATGDRRWAGAFAASGVFGILSHLTFVYALAGFGAWIALALARRRDRPDPAALAILALPVVALAGLWFVDLRHLVIGGGPAYRIADVVRELLRATFGLPAGWPEVIGIAAVAVASLEVVALARERDPRWIFFPVAIAVAPALLVAVQRPEFLAPRYFLVGVPFLLALFASALARLARAGAAGRAAFAAALVAFCVVNAAPLHRLLRDGRGRYGEAVAFMVALTPGDVVTVGSDHDFRNANMLLYYARRLRVTKAVRYAPAGPGVPPPLWFLRHEFTEDPRPDRILEVEGHRYDLAGTFPYAGLSGWSWIVYRLSD